MLGGLIEIFNRAREPPQHRLRRAPAHGAAHRNDVPIAVGQQKPVHLGGPAPGAEQTDALGELEHSRQPVGVAGQSGEAVRREPVEVLVCLLGPVGVRGEPAAHAPPRGAGGGLPDVSLGVLEILVGELVPGEAHRESQPPGKQRRVSITGVRARSLGLDDQPFRLIPVSSQPGERSLPKRLVPGEGR